MESTTYMKHMKITPAKFRDVLRMVKGKTPVDTHLALQKIDRKAARALAKIVQSAISNAKQTLKVGEDMLQFRLFTVEEGTRLKRFNAVSRGMARAFYRRQAHIKIILGEVEMVQASVPVVKTETNVKTTVKKSKDATPVKVARKPKEVKSTVKENKE